MAKDTFYFSHDYNCRNDEKIKMLIRKHGMVGYGIFWSIVEDLYNNSNSLKADFEGIAFDYRVDVSLVISVLKDFDLFQFDGDCFGSISVERRLNDRDIKSKKAQLSAQNRWNKVKNNANASESDANALRQVSDRNAIKERKGKEIKESKDYTPNGVLPTSSPEKKLPFIVKDSLKEEWELVSKEISESIDVTIQKKLLQKFIVVKKPQFIEPYATAWNMMASANGFSTLRDDGLSEKRKNKLKARLKESSFDFMRIMWSIPRNPKYKGSIGENEWKVDFDYVITNDTNYLKIIEGVPNRDAYDIMIHKMLG